MHVQTGVNSQVALCKHALKRPLPPVVRATAEYPSTARLHRRTLKQRRGREVACQRICASQQPDTPAAAVTALSDAPLQQLSGERTALPAAAGVYAVYDQHQKLQYIGLSRKVSPLGLLRSVQCFCPDQPYIFFGTIQVAVSIANHVQDLPEYAHSVRVATLSNPTRENLTAAWKQWVESAGTQ